MRKVTLSMQQQEKYEIIKRVSDSHMSIQTAAVKIGCSTRTVYRLLKKYQQEGKASFIHGNTGRTPAHAFTPSQKLEIVHLYNNKYWDTNFSHCSDLLQKHDGITISPSCLRKLLLEEFVLSPKATRKTRKETQKRLRESLKTSASKKEKELLAAAILAAGDAHPRRPRCAHFGEMIQMDASVHLWFGDTKTHLHIAIDDYSGDIVGAYFDTQETLHGYYHVLYQILTNYGIPHMFYTDKRTVFEYERKTKKDITKDTYTQFSYACKQLGIVLQTTSVAQAKGRVERAFQTLQTRLPVELRLAGITNLHDANVFLNSYIKEYNEKFGLLVNYSKSVFVKQPKLELIHQILAVLSERTVDCGHSIRYEKKFYKLLDARGLPVYYHQKSKGLVIHTFTGELLFSIKDKIYIMEEIPQHEKTSRNFDIKPVQSKPKKQHIPDARHPWRLSSFSKHVGYGLSSEHLIV